MLPLKSLLKSILGKFYANHMSILCQNAITKSVFFKHVFDLPLLNNVKKNAALVKRYVPLKDVALSLQLK